MKIFHTKYHKTLPLVILTFFVTTIALFSSNKIALSAPTTIPIKNTNLEVGKVYPVEISLYKPSGSNLKDIKGNPVDVLKPGCLVTSGFPYGTKFRIFGTGTAKDGTICTSLGDINNNPLISNPKGNFQLSLVTTDLSEVNSFGLKQARATIISLGDNQMLDFTDTGAYRNDDSKITTSSKTTSKADDDLIKDFYIKNDILYYRCEVEKEGGQSSGSKSSFVLTKDKTLEIRQEYILRFLTKVGFTLEQAAGIVGNITAESRAMPSCIEGGGNPACYENFYDEATGKYNEEYEIDDVGGGRGFGLVQFTDSAEKRVVKEVARIRNRHHFDMDVQIESFLVRLGEGKGECMTNSPSTKSNIHPNQGLHLASDAIEATFTFLDCYGVPASTNCGYYRQTHLRGSVYYRCWKDIAEEYGTCNQIAVGKHKTNKSRISCEVTEQIGMKVYNLQKANRGGIATKLVEKYRGIIPDGEGIDIEEFKQRAKDLMSGVDTSGFEFAYGSSEETESIETVPCNQTPDQGNLNDLQKLVAKSAWPLSCGGKDPRERSENGLYCNADKPTDFYADLIKCRKGGSSNSCQFVGGETGGNNGADCFGYVATMIQESGIDTGYTSSADRRTSAGWQKIFDIGQVDTSQLKPGDVGIYRGQHFHTILYSGDIPNFESPITSASYSTEPGRGRFPTASRAIASADKYAWYRKVGNNE